MMRALLSRNSDAVLALFVVAVAAMLLIPLPTPLLDLLLALNISFALLLLLVGLYMPNALALLAFPALLLLTTLFRLSLNVASSRLILSQGDAGRVIEAFGRFLVGSDVVVGLIIFTIITIVNFIVIARGASRVSEVAARFALDALPGKQMAIDADLRANLISAEEARRRRDELRKESQLYGAMDGAMKFVQGDAIAGFFIILTNILGGLYKGVAELHMPLVDAVATYTVLTVGDGLVTQIPALLISICAGIVVTRVSSGENTTLGSDLAVQLFRSPFLLYVAAIVVILIGFLPDLPFMPFAAVAVLFSGTGVFVSRTSGFRGAALAVRREAGGEPKGLIGVGDADERSEDEVPLQISLDAALLARAYQSSLGHYRDWYVQLQRDFYEHIGLRLPDLQVSADELLPVGHYSVALRGGVLLAGKVPLDAVVVEMNPDLAESLGLESMLTVAHPVSGESIFWSRRSPALQRVVDAAGIRTFDFMEYICLLSAAFIRRHPEEVLSITDVHGSLKQIQKKYPGLITEAFNSEFINVSRMTNIVHELVREGLNVRDFRQVVESTAAYCSTYGLSMVQEDDFDVQDIVSYIRIERKRQMLSRLMSPRGTLKVFTLSPQVEEIFENMHLESSVTLAIEPDTFEAMRGALQGLVGPISARGLLPVVVLCSGGLRHKVSNFLRATQRFLGVVTFEELDPQIPIEPAGVWQI